MPKGKGFTMHNNCLLIVIIIVFSSLFLTACGGGGGGGGSKSDSSPEELPEVELSRTNLNIGSIEKLSESVHNPLYHELGLHAALKDKDGRVHIFYGGKELRHRYHDGIDWVEEVVDNNASTGKNATVDIDNNGVFHVLYQSEFQSDRDLTEVYPSIKYAYGSFGDWEVELTPIKNSALGDQLGQITIGPDNLPAIAYQEDGTVKFAARSLNGSWNIEDVHETDIVTNGLSVISLVVDSMDNPHVFFVNNRSETLDYAIKSDGVWVVESLDVTIDDVSFFLHSAEIDNSNNIYLCYASRNDLYCSKKDGGLWVEEKVDDGIFDFPELVLDDDGNVHLGYYALTGSDLYLRYAENTTGAWLYTDNLIAPSGSWGQQRDEPINLIVSGMGDVRFYFKNNPPLGSADSQLMEFLWDSVVWTESIIHSIKEKNVMAGEKSSVAIDSNGSTHIAYIATGVETGVFGSLHYATNKTGVWVVDKPSRLGFFSFGYFDEVKPEIFLDNFGSAHIVLSGGLDFDSGSYYLTNSSGVWESQLLPEEYLGYEYSFFVDDDKNVHIAYITATTGGNIRPWQIRYATDESGSWVDELVYQYEDPSFPTISPSDAETDVAISKSNLDEIIIGFIRIAGSSPGPLMQATKAERNWGIETILENTDIPAVIIPGAVKTLWSNPSMAITMDGSIHLAYEASECDGLFCYPVGIKYSSDSSGLWVHKLVDIEVYTQERPVRYFLAEDPAIAVSQDGVAYITYYHSAYEHVRLAKVSDCLTQSIVIEEGMSTYDTSSIDLSINASISIRDGAIRMSYFDNPKRSLRSSEAQLDSYSEGCSNNMPQWLLGVNEMGEMEYVLENLGEDVRSINTVSLFSGENFSITSDMCTGATLSPLDSCSVNVEASGNQAGEYWDVIEVVTDSLATDQSQARTFNLMVKVE